MSCRFIAQRGDKPPYSEYFWTKEYLLNHDLRCAVVAPLISQDIGIWIIAVFARHPHSIGRTEQERLERVAAQISSAIENSRLFQQRDQLALALEGIGEGVAFLGVEGDFQFVNSAFLDIYGFTSREVLGKNATDLIVPKDLTDQAIAYDAFSEGIKLGWTGEIKRQREDGELIDVLLTIRPVKDKLGHVLGRIGVSRDITERKEAEEALRESEEQHRTLLDVYPDGVVLEIDRKIVYANPALREMTGFAEHEILNAPPEEFIVPEDRERAIAVIHKLLAGTTGDTREYRVSKKDGGIVPTEITSRLVTFAGKPALLSVIRDITERKRVEQRVQEASRLAAIGELAAGVAHEINNPLTSVIGFSQMVLEADPPSDIKEDLQIVYSQAQRAAKVVKNLLLFGRKTGPNKEAMELNSIIQRSIELKLHEFKLCNVRVQCELDQELPDTLLDEHQMIQVFFNLLTNAQDAFESQWEGGLITVKTTQARGMIRVTVSDDGPGIPPENLNKIFDPFFTTKEVGRGTGLGLSICHGILKEHGGEIWAESVEGQGATICFEIPVLTPADHSDSALPTMFAGTPGTKHVLVVDDEITIRDMLRRALELERYTVDLAENGEEAWRKMCAMHYDCIVLDLKMPVMGGQELYKLINEVDESLAQKVLFITGDTIGRDTRDFLTATEGQALHKPFELQELLGQVRTLTEIT